MGFVLLFPFAPLSADQCLGLCRNADLKIVIYSHFVRGRGDERRLSFVVSKICAAADECYAWNAAQKTSISFHEMWYMGCKS